MRKEEEYKEILIKKREEIEKQLLKFTGENKEDKGDYVSKFPDYGKEEQDNAEEVKEYGKALSLEHHLESELEKINQAIEKIEKKRGFGICEECGGKIEEERLEIRPQSLKCMVCAKKIKKEIE